MGKKFLSIIMGIITLITAWSTIKMFLAMSYTGNHLKLSYAPIPIQLKDPNMIVIVISAVIFSIITVILGTFTIKLANTKNK